MVVPFALCMHDSSKVFMVSPNRLRRNHVHQDHVTTEHPEISQTKPFKLNNFIQIIQKTHPGYTLLWPSKATFPNFCQTIQVYKVPAVKRLVKTTKNAIMGFSWDEGQG